MTPLVAVIVALVVVGSVLAMAEASMTRMTRHRARALVLEGRRRAVHLERIQSDPAPYLNSIYLAVMLTQNGSAILVAIVADRTFGDLGITVVSVAFTLVYFVLVEAMSKTFAVLRSDRVALLLAPVVIQLRRVFSVPVHLLIGLGNVLLPGKGLREGPFVSAEEIRQIAEAGEESGSIASREKQLIDSVLDLGQLRAADVMIPRPDMAVVDAGERLRAAVDLMISTGHGRLPVYEEEPDNVVGVVYVKDVLSFLRRGENDAMLKDVARPAHFVPEAIRLSDALRELQARRIQMAIVTDEHGDVAGLLTVEDIVEQIVGDIADSDDVGEPDATEIGPGEWRIRAKLRVREFNELVSAGLPEDEDWHTIGGLVSSVLAKIPEPGDEIEAHGFRFRVLAANGPRIGTIRVQRVSRSG